MKNSRKGFDVFEFTEEDELVESAAGRFTKKLRNPRADTPAITKYQFLECFNRGASYEQAESSDVSYIDVDSSNSGHKPKSQGLYARGTLRGDDASTERISGLDEILVASTTSNEQNALSNPDNSESGDFFRGGSKLDSCGMKDSCLGVPSVGQQSNSILPDLPSDDCPVDAISDGENEGYLEDSASDHYSSDCEMEDIDLAVVAPDYLIYGERYCTESLLTFSCSCIKLEGTNAYGNKESFSSEWAIVEVTSIETQWFSRVETALIKLHIMPSAEIEAENVDRTSGTLELKFAVCEPRWFEKQERIMSLDARYTAIWRLVLDADARDDGFVGKNSLSSSRTYFPNFDEPFEDVIYPQGDPDAVSISKRDVELLEPETFINDTIIDFYIKYLKNKIRPEDGHRFHFFNSFFFRKLADLDKDPSSASQGRAAFQRVRKWTRKVNLFEKDYVFIPINFNLHWSLIVICHPGEVANFKDEDIDKSDKVPCILHMDSIKGSHKGLKDLVQSYLWEEWKERKAEASEDFSKKFFNLRFVPLELPQQENSFDCGLFLLHYVERFLEDAPVHFSPFKIEKCSNFLNLDWFPPEEASLKRAFIQNLIYELVEDHSQRITATTNNDEHQSSGFPENGNGKESGIELLSESRSSARICHGNSSCSTASEGIQIELLATSSGGAGHIRDSGLVFREFFEQGPTAGSFTDAQYRPSNKIEPLHQFKCITSPIQENTETDEQFALAPSDEAGFRPLAGLMAGPCSTSFSTKGSGTLDPFWNPGISVLQDKHDDGDSSVETSSYGSQSSSELGVDVHVPTSDFVYLREQEETEKSRSVSPENVGCITGSPASASRERLETWVVEDSQEADMMAESKEGDDSHVFLQETFSAPTQQGPDIGEKRNHSSENLQLSGDDPTSESDQLQARKRLRLVPPLNGERRRTRSVAKD
ncbi:Peptidase C48 [Macleaya cordata]|uniref:Peptidase C48 n=1 Tax=Macleaya cordata TaxID=56857 RepID=A0A200QIZ9_MACCD|nr:Peptidase C48 [Macleaya cordata]